MADFWGRLAAQPRWLVLLLAALAARAVTFGNPIVHVDEEFYFVTARAMVDGALPYVDVWDRKPIGLFLLYLPAAALGVPLGIWAYQAMALAAAVATALLIARFAERLGWGGGALPAALAYLLWLSLLEGQGGQSPVFYNLPMLGAAMLMAPRDDESDSPGRRTWRAAAGLLLVGIAIQLKYTAVFEGAFFGIAWLVLELQRGRGLARTALVAIPLALLAFAPTLAAWGGYALLGHGREFVFANFESIFSRNPDAIWEQALNLAKIALILSPLAATAIVGGPDHVDAATRRLQRWLYAWLAVAALAVLAIGPYFNHSALPLLVPLCCAAARFFARHRHGRIIALPLLGLVLLGGVINVAMLRHGRGGPGQLDRITAAIGRGPGCLYVYSGNAMLYVTTGRCAVTAYRHPPHLSRQRETGAIGVDQQEEIDRIFARAPEVVVMRNRYRGERRDIHDHVLRRLAAGYRLETELPLGNETIHIFRRLAPLSPPAP